jgi:hypothetical protein
MEYWNTVKSKNSQEGFNDYLKRYPSGFFVSVASDYLQLLDTQLAIATIEKYATEEDREKIERDKQLYALTAKRIGSEDKARYALAKRLSRLDVPTF